MKKTIGLFAHVDSGKTTCAEQLLYLTHSIKKCGRVDYQNSFLDHHEIEKERGITVFSEQAYFSYGDNEYFLIDTPGHIDFSMEMERSISVMDYAILIISAVEGIQAHTETIWSLLKTYKIPTFIFINKIDREGANVEKVMSDIEIRLNGNPVFIQTYKKIETLSLDLIEKIAESDESLMIEYFNENLNPDFWKLKFKEAIIEKQIIPIMAGSALKNQGIDEFLRVLDDLTMTHYALETDFLGKVYKVRYDERGERITFIKILSGTLTVKDQFLHPLTQLSEKINQIRLYQGNKYETVSKAEAGQLIGVTGLTTFKVGESMGVSAEQQSYKLIPTLSVSVGYDETLNHREVLSYFKQLEDEDPSLAVNWNERSGKIEIQIMGLIQLDVIKDLMKNRHQIDVSFGDCEVIYLETIKDAVVGRGHYEPLKHYAEVHLLLEPGTRGSGVQFKSQCHVDDLAQNYQNLIKKSILEDKGIGILTGSQLTDLSVTLITGAAHQKHTSGGDFKEATQRALRQGLEKAQNQILEPYYSVTIDVRLELMGKVMTDIQKAYGTVEPPVASHDRCIIKCFVPVVTFMNYPTEFLSYTKGDGKIMMHVFGYDSCHNEEKVIEMKQYNKDADRQNPSASIFCSKGSGFVVPWDLADQYMHCKEW